MMNLEKVITLVPREVGSFLVGNIVVALFVVPAVILEGIVVLADDGTSESHQRVDAEIQRFLDNTASVPDCDDFFSIVLRPQYSFTYGELGRVYRQVKSMQRPTISSQSLRQLLESKKRSIRDFHVIYTVENVDSMDNKMTLSKYEFAMKDGKYLSEVAHDIQRDKTVFRRGYNGDHLYELVTYSDGTAMAGVGVLKDKGFFSCLFHL